MTLKILGLELEKVVLIQWLIATFHFNFFAAFIFSFRMGKFPLKEYQTEVQFYLGLKKQTLVWLVLPKCRYLWS
jgi:hypothetical protein